MNARLLVPDLLTGRVLPETLDGLFVNHADTVGEFPLRPSCCCSIVEGTCTASVPFVTAAVPVAIVKCPTLHQRRSSSTSSCSAPLVVYIAPAPAASRVAPASPFSMRCASTSREHMILVAVAHREGVHLLRFKVDIGAPQVLAPPPTTAVEIALGPCQVRAEPGRPPMTVMTTALSPW